MVAPRLSSYDLEDGKKRAAKVLPNEDVVVQLRTEFGMIVHWVFRIKGITASVLRRAVEASDREFVVLYANTARW